MLAIRDYHLLLLPPSIFALLGLCLPLLRDIPVVNPGRRYLKRLFGEKSK